MLGEFNCYLLTTRFKRYKLKEAGEAHENHVENILGKGENAGYQHFLVFPKMFGSLKICLRFVNPSQNKPWFLRVCSISLLKALWEKEKLLIMSNFSRFPHSVFYSFGELSAIFISFEIVVCKLFEFGRV